MKILMPEPFSHAHDEYVGKYLASGPPKIIGIGREVVGARKDGSTFPLELALNELKLKERRLFIGIIRDISRRKQKKSVIQALEKTTSLPTSIPLNSDSTIAMPACKRATVVASHTVAIYSPNKLLLEMRGVGGAPLQVIGS